MSRPRTTPTGYENRGVPPGKRRAVFERYGDDECHYCYRPFARTQLTIDHIVPRARGGSDDIENLVPACRPCNSSKRDLDLGEWKMRSGQWDGRVSGGAP